MSTTEKQSDGFVAERATVADNVTLAGNLVADPELKVAASGVVWCSGRMAVNERVYDKAKDEWTDGDTFWVGVLAFRELAENVAASLTKGTRIVATGKVRFRTYQTEAGETRVAHEIVCTDIAPSLRFATAEVTKVKRSGGGNGVPSPPEVEEPF